MKKYILPAVCAAFMVCALFTGCTKKQSDSASSAGKTLYLYNWTYYTPDSVIAKFEQKYNVKVVSDFYTSNEEMFAKLMAGGSGYDIIFPSQDYTSIMITRNMLAKLDHTKMPNLVNVSAESLQKASYDPEMNYSVPYYMGAAGIAVNTKKVPQYDRDWSIFARTDLKDRMSMFDDIREVMGDALMHLGYSCNSIDPLELAAARDLINTQWKPNLVKFDSETFAKSFAAGEFWVVQAYSEGIYAETPADMMADVDFFIPAAGGPMYIDSMVILESSKNKELAMEFINFIHDPQIYAEFLDQFRFIEAVNPAAKQYMKTTPLYSADDLKNCQTKNDVGEALELYDEMWQEVRFE